jgi:predicted MPP superfamily phosphohydrolase
MEVYNFRMKICVVQLSDIHVNEPDDSVLARGGLVATSAINVAPSADAYLLAISGDCAFSGRSEQYGLAEKFLGEVRSELSRKDKQVFVAMTPGNHDLDLTTEPDTRQILLSSSREKLSTIDLEGETVKQLVSVQSAYFDFEASFTGDSRRSAKDYLARSHVFLVDKKILRLNNFNSAWVSTNPEQQGRLLFPVAAIPPPDHNADLTISMLHHPYNWFTAENASAVRRAIEVSSDIVLTGHEHRQEAYQKVHDASGSIQYVEGGVLQESGSAESGFNLLLIDTDAKNYESWYFSWDGDSYTSRSNGSHVFIRNKLLHKKHFQINHAYFSFLNQTALAIRHPDKQEILLDDLFVYPTISLKTIEKPTITPRLVYSDAIVEHMRTAERVLLVGDGEIGKSSMAKRLYRDLYSEGTLIPVLISGSEFAGFSEKDVRKVIRAAVAEQYDEHAVERYFAADAAERVLIVDDWQDVRYNIKGRSQIVRFLNQFFGKMIIFTNRHLALDEIAEPGSLKGVFTDFQYCEIKEFGRQLTGKLIEKWHAISAEQSNDPSEFHYAVADSEHKILTVIGKGLLPAYPILLIGLLQADASPGASAQNIGSYGHILEALITAHLAGVSNRSIEIGMMYTYVSRIAYFLFKHDRSFLSEQEFSELHTDYCEVHKMKIGESSVLKDLLGAQLLVKSSDGYRFRYRGSYCYFVARYFSERIVKGPALRVELNDITDKLIYDDFTYIVMFYLYLTRDPELIERLLSNAAAIYASTPPSKLEDDVDFVNKLLTDKPAKVTLPSNDIALNRAQVRLQQDAAEGKIPEEKYRTSLQRVPYSEGLDEILKANIALQSIRVMGQVLRNFPGVLEGEPKYRLAEACYMLGLRTLGRFMEIANTQRENIRTLFAQIFIERHPLATEEEAAVSADQALIWLTGAAAYGMIKRVCNSVGLRELELTFDDVKANYADLTSVQFIHLAIRLEHFRGAPEAEIYDLQKVIGKNHFAYKLLRDLVAEYLLLHNTDTRVFQRLGSEFDIITSDPRFHINKALTSGSD